MNKLEKLSREEMEELELAIEEMETDIIINKYGLSYEDIKSLIYEGVN